MRALAATALTLAFVLMAFVTYLAVRGDPMGGEPRLLVKVPPPDLGKLQPSASRSLPVPAQSAPAATTDATAGTMSAAQDKLTASAAETEPPAQPTQARVTVAPDPLDDPAASDGPGIAVPIPH